MRKSSLPEHNVFTYKWRVVMSNFSKSHINTSKLTTLDEVFYKFAAECKSNGLYVVFKGGCLLRHILRTYGKTHLRGTKDIDFDVFEESFNKLEELLKSRVVFGKLRDDWKMNVTFKELGIDCDMQIIVDDNTVPYVVYNSPDGEFYGVTIEDIIGDKIASMSSRMILRRVKDLIDICELSRINYKYDMDVLRSTLDSKIIGDFSCFNEMNITELNALCKEIGLLGSDVINVVTSFVFPLLGDDELIWNGRVWIKP
jgi:predicted nucleotidyltransferase component of viral defense system